MKLKIIKQLPGDFFTTEVKDIAMIFEGPTLVHLNEGKGNPLFISVLLHGNEHSGFLALQELLQEETSRECVLFFANPTAAAQNSRFVVGQVDFNRVWSGGECDQAVVARDVLNYVRPLNLLLSIDIHNNSGKNPFYSCINRTDEDFLSLAQFFSPYIVYFTEPHEVQSMAFSKLCPAITIEAGQSGEPSGIEILVKKLRTVLSWQKLPRLQNRPELFHTVARFRIPHSMSFDFQGLSETEAELSFKSDIEDYNFRNLPVGFSFGHCKKGSGLWLEGDCGRDIFGEYLSYKKGEIIVKKSFVPAMLTTNRSVIEKDCFGYVMENYTYNN